MKNENSLKTINTILDRGVEKIIKKDSLAEKLKSNKRLRIKHGIDPTGPEIHIGRATQLLKLKEFQNLGHQIVLIIGDFTAQIGDASDKNSVRKILSEKEISENMKNYTKQIGKILDMNKVEIHYNSEWLEKLSAKDILSLSMNFTAQQMIQRRNFKERWEKRKPIGLHELSYPLLQGYDSVAIKADVELGGYDQLFNLNIGREVQQIFKQNPQDIIGTKMLPGLDGRKMSTSWGNVINLTDEPKEMYGKIMSMRDEYIYDYFELCTRIPLKEIANIKEEIDNNSANPRDMKAKLGREIVTMFYDEKKAIEAEKEFERIFREKKTPINISEINVKKEGINILNLLVKINLTNSKSNAKRLVLAQGVKINGKIQNNWKKIVKIKKGLIIQIGRKKFIRII